MASIGKIVLKNSTKISLNERFTAYRQQSQNAGFFRQKTQKQASVENTRLAQQMARRPTVIAALRIKKRSLQQRLGQKRKPTNVRSRLDFSFRGRLGGSNALRGRNRRAVRGGYSPRPGTSPLIKARLGPPSAARKYKKFAGRSNQIGAREYIRSPKSMNQQRRGRSRKVHPFRGRGGWNRPQPLPTKQELDNELDQYMAETKGPLDPQMVTLGKI